MSKNIDAATVDEAAMWLQDRLTREYAAAKKHTERISAAARWNKWTRSRGERERAEVAAYRATARMMITQGFKGGSPTVERRAP